MISKNKYRLKIISKVFPYTTGVKRFFILLAMINLLFMAADLLTPQFYRLFVDEVIIGAKINLFGFVIAGYLGLFAIMTALTYITNYASNRLENRLLYRVKRKILDNYLSMPFTTLEQWSMGNLQMRIDSDTNNIAGFPNSQIIGYAISLVNLIVAAVLLLMIEWKLALFSFMIIPLTFFVDNIFSKKEMKLHDIEREFGQRRESWLQNSIAGWKEIKALNLQSHEKRVYAGHLHNYARHYSRWIYLWTARVMIIPRLNTIS